MISFFEKRPIFTLIFLASLLVLPNLTALDVTIMEARNFITAREMLTDGNWVLPTMNGAPRYEKPPLPTWITAGSAAIFGLKNLWGLRLPTGLMVILLSVMLYMLSRKLNFSKTSSLHNGLIGMTSFYVIAIVFEAPWDIYAHSFMLCGIYFLVRLFREQEGVWKNGVLAALFIGASVLSKGPVSFYALFLPFLISYIVIYRKEIPRKKWFFLWGSILLGLVIGFFWYVYVRYADPETFAKIATRETGNWTSYNVRPFYYYWSFFTQSGLWTIPAFIGLLYPYLKTRVNDLKGYRFTFLWTLTAVILLSVIPEKKSRYLMPVLIPLALNTGYYINYLLRSFKGLKDWRETFSVYINFGIMALLFCLGPLAIMGWMYSEDMPPSWNGYILIIPVILAGIALIGYLKQKIVSGILYTTVIGIITLVLFGTTMFKKQLSAPAVSALNLDEHIPMYSHNMDVPEMWYALGRKAPNFGNDYELKYPIEDQFYFIDYAVDEGRRHQGYTRRYVIDKVREIDINPKRGKRRSRKWMGIYLATKRE